MEVGIAYDLKSEMLGLGGFSGPPDRYEEYDTEQTVAAIAAALAEGGYTPRRLGGGPQLVRALLECPPALVFNIAEGRGTTRSREAQVPALCEMLGVPFTHSDALALGLSLDKAMAKRVAGSQGVPTPAFAVLEQEPPPEGLRLAFPLMVKPLFEGSSIGIRRSSRVTDVVELRRVLRRLLRDYDQPVLIEEFCSGPEFTVGVVGTGSTARVLGVMEIAPRRTHSAEFVYSLEVKQNYQEEVEYLVPPRQPRSLVERAGQVALGAFQALGCRDIGRVDVRVGADGEPKFLEINPLPGLNPITGDLPILAAGSGMPYAQLISAIVASARQRLPAGSV